MTDEQKRLLAVAKGCKTYGGGFYGKEYDIFQRGVETVIRAIEESINDKNNTQVKALEHLGKK